MTEMPIRFAHNEGMKTTTVGIIGTVTSFTLESYSQMASAVAATITALYMAFKCIDWVVDKILARRARKANIKK